MSTTETRRVLTKMGQVSIDFDSEGENRFTGTSRAIDALRSAVLLGVNRHGVGVTLDSLQPDDLEFLAAPGSGLILEPVDPAEVEPEPPEPEGESAAVVALEVALDTLKTNEPINRAEGNIDQAELEAQSAVEIEQALEVLRTDAVADLPALRERFASATTAAEKLALAKAIREARAPGGSNLTAEQRRRVEESLKETEGLLAKQIAAGEYGQPMRIEWYTAHAEYLRAVLAGTAKIGDGPKPTDRQNADWDTFANVLAERARLASERSESGVIAGYVTPSGKVGMEVKRMVFGDRVTYSYTGEYGAGSGTDIASLVKIIEQTKAAKPRMKLGWGKDIVNINTFITAPVMSQGQAQFAGWTAERANAAGYTAAKKGDPRMTPVDFPVHLARDWLLGWDNARSIDADEVAAAQAALSDRVPKIKALLTAQGFDDEPGKLTKGGVTVWISEGSTSIQQRLDLLKAYVSYTVKSTESAGVKIEDDVNQTEEEVAARIVAAVEADAGYKAQVQAPAGPTFRYALMNRPAGFETLPKGLAYTVEPRPAAGQPHHDMARHGILVAQRELTAEEVKGFELAPLIDGPEAHGELAGKVAEAMAEHASAYLEQAKSEPEYFRSAVMQTVEASASGVRYSIGDPALLVQAVADKLAAMVPAAAPAPDPAPQPTGAGARDAHKALLEQVAAGQHPNMLDPELAELIEAALLAHPDDADMQALGERAVVAYSNGLLAAT